MLKVIVYWIVQFLIYVAIIVVAGGILGCLSAILLGCFYDFEEKGFQLWLHGASIGARYAGVWAGGIAIVLCFIRGHRLKFNNQNSKTK